MSTIGSEANQVPINGFLGEVAYLDKPDLKSGTFSAQGGNNGWGTKPLLKNSGDIEVDENGAVIIPRDGLYAVDLTFNMTVGGNPSVSGATSLILNGRTLKQEIDSNSVPSPYPATVVVSLKFTQLLSLNKGDSLRIAINNANGPYFVYSANMKVSEAFIGKF